MYTSEQIDSIMKELDLDTTDANARQVVERLANAKPTVPVIDQNFISQLRAELQQRAGAGVASMQMQSEPNESKFIPKTINYFNMLMNKTLVAAIVVAIIVIGAGGAWYASNTDRPLFQGGSFGGGDQVLSGKYDVKSVPEESFGNLDKVAIVTATDAAKLNSSNGGGTNGVPTGMGAGGSAMAVAPTTVPATASASAEIAMPADKMIAPGEPYPGQVYYEFTYEGSKNLEGLNATQPVLKRTKPVQYPGFVSRVVSLLSFGLIDLSALQNVQLQNISFVEDREYGYGAYVDVQQGTVSMYQNYEKWPQPDYTQCKEGICNALRDPKELPADADVMAAVETFIQQYKISKDGYGTPRVVEPWRVGYEIALAQGSTSIYIPEQVQVVYPLMLENKEVYDESGNLYGLNVMVDAKTLRVTSVYNLVSKQFERSEYKGETDSRRILEVAQNGGFRNYNYPDQQIGKRVELKLGAPTMQMVNIYYSTDNYRTNSELYMPALVFPIQNWKEAGYWRQSVMVPLVKSILDSDAQPQPIPMPVDLPVSNVQGAATTEPAIKPQNGAR